MRHGGKHPREVFTALLDQQAVDGYLGGMPLAIRTSVLLWCDELILCFVVKN